MKNLRNSMFFCFLLCSVCPATFGQSKKMPDLYFSDTENNIFTNKDIPQNTALLLVYFRTDCDECRHSAQVIKNNAAKYPLMIWMVSPNDKEELGIFEYMTGLMDIKNVRVLQDSKDIMHRLFSFSALPFGVLFDKNSKEIKTYDYLPDAKTVIKDLGKK